MTDQPDPLPVHEAQVRAYAAESGDVVLRQHLAAVLAEYDRLLKAVTDTRAYVESRPYSEYPLRTSTLHELLTGRADVPPNGGKS